MATSAWPEAVQRVTSFLREARAEVRVEEFPEGTPTAKDAAQAVGCELGQIVKSLVFVRPESGRPLLVLSGPVTVPIGPRPFVSPGVRSPVVEREPSNPDA